MGFQTMFWTLRIAMDDGTHDWMGPEVEVAASTKRTAAVIRRT